jgi:hypothetical protein
MLNGWKVPGYPGKKAPGSLKKGPLKITIEKTIYA